MFLAPIFLAAVITDCYVRANTVFLILNWVNIEGDRDSQDFWGFLAILVQLLTLQTKWTELSYNLLFNYSSFCYNEILLACFSHSNSHIMVQKLKIVILCWCHWPNLLCAFITHSLQYFFWNELIGVHFHFKALTEHFFLLKPIM